MSAIDYLIIGQGIAGSTLGWMLHHAGHKIKIIDKQHAGAASKVAAGMVNPLAGRRLSPMANFHEVFEDLETFHAEIESVIGTNHWHPKPILRLLKNDEQLQQFTKRLQDPPFQALVKTQLPPGFSNGALADSYGGFITNYSGYVNIPKLIANLQKWFLENQLMQQADFRHHDLVIQSDKVNWQDITTRNIIFAEGWQVQHNPWFAEQPWDPVRGDIITLKGFPLPTNQIINKGTWMLPYEDHTWRCGSTYRRDRFTLYPDRKGRDKILKQITAICGSQNGLQMLQHQVGIRPCTKPQKPLILRHTQYPHMWLFNGFGSKGALLTPHHAKAFCASL